MSDYIFLPEDCVSESECIISYDNSIDFYALVLKSFVKESIKIINNMKSFIEQGDIEQYRIIVHGLKSSAASVGFSELSKHAKESEYCCKGLDWDGAVKRHDALIDELQNVVSLIEDRVSQRQERLKSE